MTSTLAALPPGTRVLHIGLPKTGTTAIQYALANARPELPAWGVIYPGESLNHINGTSAVMNRPAGWNQEVPAMEHWDALLAEIEAQPQARSIISYEQVTEATDADAARFAESLGASIHVLITLRPLVSMIPSVWQQFVKNRLQLSWEEWLDAALAGDQEKAGTPLFFQCYDAAEQVKRWVTAVGASNVTVIMADSANPNLLFDSVAALLGLPQGVLVAPELDGYAANRSLSREESALVRQVNVALDEAPVSRRDYGRYVAHGAVAAMQLTRKPTSQEGRIDPPPAAVEVIRARAQAQVDSILASGVQVVGNLAQFASVRPTTATPEPDDIDVEVAAAAFLGMASKVLSRGLQFEDKESSGTLLPRLEMAVTQATTHELEMVLAARAAGGEQ